jgi:hypothetical protein
MGIQWGKLLALTMESILPTNTPQRCNRQADSDWLHQINSSADKRADMSMRVTIAIRAPKLQMDRLNGMFGSLTIQLEERI